jgi:hypothetical protein
VQDNCLLIAKQGFSHPLHQSAQANIPFILYLSLSSNVTLTESPGCFPIFALISLQAKEELGIDTITVIADKGYYSASQFAKCKDDNIIPIVSKADHSHMAATRSFGKQHFKYDETADGYICPDSQCESGISAALPDFQYEAGNPYCWHPGIGVEDAGMISLWFFFSGVQHCKSGPKKLEAALKLISTPFSHSLVNNTQLKQSII